MLFVGMHGAREASEADLASIDAQVRAIQTTLYRYEGSLNKLSVDEKGITAVAAMGLPPFAHEDDARRAVQAARQIAAELAEQGMPCSIGVAHGRVFCGLIGNERRCEYTVIGDVVNLAARLMQAAGGGILCDAATADRARSHIHFQALPPIQVKGKTEPVTVFAPGGAKVPARRKRPLVGRTAEVARVDQRIDDLAAGRGGALLFEGDAGIGKSRLVAEAADRAKSLGVRVLEGHTDPTERSTAYHAWRPVFADLLALEPGVPTPIEQVREALNGNDHAGRLPLLNEVLALGLPDNELTSELRGQVRADNTNALLLELLADAAARGRLLIVIEDLHWIDSASLALAFLCTRRLKNTLLVLTTRVIPAEVAEPELSKIMVDPVTERVRLVPLAADEVRGLVCRRLAVDSVSEQVAELVQARAQGNPFFSEELSQGLLDSGVIVVAGGEARIREGVSLDGVALPESIDAVITARIDRLSPDEQLTLKVASVIGRVFELKLLRAVYPTPERTDLKPVLARLQERELITDEGVEDGTWSFRHALIVDAVYALMVHAQRQKLHRELAEALEREPEATRPYGRLAHHWIRAGDEARALPCLEKAGEQALRSGAYEGARSLLSEAIRLCPAGVDALRKGRLQRQAGEACFGQGDLQGARAHQEQCLATLGPSAPLSRGVVGRILSGMFTQLAHRLASNRVSRGGQDNEVALEMARAWGQLVLLHYFCGEPERLFGASLHGVNAAENAGPSPELANAYAGLAVTAGLLGANRLAEAYLERAKTTAAQVREQTATAMAHVWAGVHWTGRGEWSKARASFGLALPILDALGDRRRWTETACALSTVQHYEGHFEERLLLGAEVSARGRDTRDIQSQAWGMLDRVESLLPLGRHSEAIALLEQVMDMVSSIPRTDQLWAHGLAAVAFLRAGDPVRAQAETQRTRELMKVVPPTGFYVMEGYAGVTETCLALAEQAAGAPHREAWAGAIEGVAQLRRYARAMPFCVPRYQVCQGLALWGQGQHRRALGLWREAIGHAERIGMPYEAAKARFELGRHLQRSDPARRDHLLKACAAFDQLYASHDASRAREALEP